MQPPWSLEPVAQDRSLMYVGCVCSSVVVDPIAVGTLIGTLIGDPQTDWL